MKKLLIIFSVVGLLASGCSFSKSSLSISSKAGDHTGQKIVCSKITSIPGSLKATSNYEQIDVAFVNKDGHVIFDGKDLGFGQNPLLDHGHFAFFQKTDTGYNFVYDWSDCGSAPTLVAQLKDGHYAYVKMVGKENHVIFDGLDMGPTELISSINIWGSSISYDRDVGDGDTRPFMVVNGKIVGRGALAFVKGDDFAYYNEINTDGQEIGQLIYKGKNYGLADAFGIIDGQILYRRKINNYYHIFLNEMDLGLGDNGVVNGGHYAYTWYASEGDENGIVKTVGGNEIPLSHIIYDGKDLGSGYYPVIKDGHIAFNLGQKLIYDGKDLGNGFSEILDGNDIAFYIDGNNKGQEPPRPVILNGVNMGKGDNPFHSMPLQLYHCKVAFIRTSANDSPSIILKKTLITAVPSGVQPQYSIK